MTKEQQTFIFQLAGTSLMFGVIGYILSVVMDRWWAILCVVSIYWGLANPRWKYTLLSDNSRLKPRVVFNAAISNTPAERYGNCVMCATGTRLCFAIGVCTFALSRLTTDRTYGPLASVIVPLTFATLVFVFIELILRNEFRKCKDIL